MGVFDALPDLFTDTFGEPVVYTPIATGVPATIQAIWWERGVDAAISGLGNDVGKDTTSVELHVRAADVAGPKEGDTAQRVSNSKTMKVATPITPDGQGMIVCTLEDV